MTIVMNIIWPLRKGSLWEITIPIICNTSNHILSTGNACGAEEKSSQWRIILYLDVQVRKRNASQYY